MNVNEIICFLKLNLKDTVASCDLQLWLNYRDLSIYNRFVIKKCNKNESDAECKGCKRTLSKSASKFAWTLVANFESKMLNYQNEIYQIDVKTNANETFGQFEQPKLRPFWQLIQFPSLKLTFQPKERCLSCAAYCFNDPHCGTLDNL